MKIAGEARNPAPFSSEVKAEEGEEEEDIEAEVEQEEDEYDEKHVKSLLTKLKRKVLFVSSCKLFHSFDLMSEKVVVLPICLVVLRI